MAQLSTKLIMEEAAGLSLKGMEQNEGGPFAAIIVRDGQIIGRGWNQTSLLHDPTAHAEIQAIRNTCKELGTLELAGAAIYCTAEPCPMCMSAIYWAMLDGVYFANTKEQSAQFGFDDGKIYQELQLPWKSRTLSMVHFPNDDCLNVFHAWEQKKLAALAAGKTI